VVATELNPLLSNATAEVLEKMFFTSVAGEFVPREDARVDSVSARQSFRGTPSGSFGVRTSVATGRTIAANFLSVEQDALTETEVGEVICELANMLCGSVLSRLQDDARFELSTPRLEPLDAVQLQSATAFRSFELDEGPMVVWLRLELGNE
jgi:CheY-specific phosphatase CheX